MAPHIAFRADASLDIGSGHVMRCLTLADALRERGARCHFLCREHPGHLNALIRARGHEVQPLGAPKGRALPPGADRLAHAAWLGTTQTADAAECADALGRWQPDWLVVDHYALDAEWERAVRPLARQLMVIDDLADRPHLADLLLDQTHGRDAEDYRERVPLGCRVLTGAGHAMLRPAFAALRAPSLARRSGAALRSLLINLGGVDRDNVTGRVLDALRNSPLPPDTRITVVMGASAPWVEDVRQRTQALPWNSEVLCGVDNMAERMVASDLAIGAAGATAWERCCLGLPTVMMVLADNQRSAAEALARSGAVEPLLPGETMARDLCAFLQRAVDDPGELDRMSAQARTITDGRGTDRVIAGMMALHPF